MYEAGRSYMPAYLSVDGGLTLNVCVFRIQEQLGAGVDKHASMKRIVDIEGKEDFFMFKAPCTTAAGKEGC